MPTPTTIAPFWTDAFASETAAWMRALTFRPYFEDRELFVGCLAFQRFYATNLAISVRDLSSCATELTGADPVVVATWDGFNAMDLSTPFAKSACYIVELSADNLAQSIEDRLRSTFPNKKVTVLYQSPNFPFRLSAEPTQLAIGAVALVGLEPICWPTLGLAIPTVDSPVELREALLGLSRVYPGDLQFAIVANGSTRQTLASLRETVGALADFAHLIESPINLGYGQGTNRGLEWLIAQTQSDYLGVVNDDVLPDIDCLCEMVTALARLESMQLRPGAIGPVSNNVNGRQQVTIEPYASYPEMLQSVQKYRSSTASSVTEVRQLRGLFMLFSPELIQTIGGFDPRFGIGNFEDDDFNLRTHFAGFTTWIADGAYLFHHGSTTFKRLSVDYEANIQENAGRLAEKWGLRRFEDWTQITTKPADVDLMIPLNSWNDVAQAA